MGWVVGGYCHADEAEAWGHYASLVIESGQEPDSMVTLVGCESVLEGESMPWAIRPADQAALSGASVFGEPVGSAHVALILLAATCVQVFWLASIRGRQR